MTSMNSLARWTGLCYLAIALIGGPAYFIVSEQMIVSDDAVATAQNIIDSELYFRLGTAAWLVTMLLDVLVAYFLYTIFSKNAPRLAVVSTLFRLVYVAIHGAALIGFFGILSLLGPTANEATREIMLLANFHANGFMVSLFFFGIHLMLVGAMIIQTGMVPKFIGGLLLLAGMAYSIDTAFLALSHPESAISGHVDLFVTIAATAGELSFLLWLLVFGVRETPPLVSGGG
ncbi:MAG: DUF4386 domain-containing protein [Henriciella sp.]